MPVITPKKNQLDDYAPLINPKERPATTEDLDKFLEEHKTDNFTAEQIKEFEEKYHLKLGVDEIKPTPPGANLITTISTIVGHAAEYYTNKVKEYLKLHQLNESLTNIHFKRNTLEKNIARKWELIQEQFPETKNFQTKEQFDAWAAKVTPEQEKALQEKYEKENFN